MTLRQRFLGCAVLLAAAWALLRPTPALAYIEAPYALGRVVQEATNIVYMKIEKVDTENNLIIFRKIADLKGVDSDIIKHNIAHAGFNPREWQNIMAWAQVGRTAVMFRNDKASETCIDRYWYQCMIGGEWQAMYHGEPYLLRTFAGKPDKMAAAVTAILAGQEVVVPCMADGDKNALQLRSGKMQRMKASARIMDYDEKRDFAGWGNEEYARITTMPGFSHYGTIGRVDPGASAIAAVDLHNDGLQNVCLAGETKVMLLQTATMSMEEVSIPVTGGARGACWGDWNGDGKPDLLLAAPTGPVLLTNTGNGFKDDSALLPREKYYNVTAAVFMDYDGDGHPDILLANGFLGLRIYHNRTISSASAATQPVAFEDASANMGLGPNGAGSTVKGDRLIVADVNGDGRPDFLYCAGEGLLVLNTPKGFVEARDSGLSFKPGRITPAFADCNGDKFIDLLVPQNGGCKLFTNDGHGHFTDATAHSGDLAKFTGTATCAIFADLNKSGQADLILGCMNGPNRIFRNAGSGVFSDVTEQLGLSQRIFNTRAMCAADVNKDGVPDLIMNDEGRESAVLLTAPPRSTARAAAQ